MKNFIYILAALLSITAQAAPVGAAYSVYRMPSSGTIPAYGAVDLSQSAAVTGVLGAANGGTGSAIGGGVLPVGSIIPWIGGYFGNGSNGSFTNVLANTVANVNALLNSSGYYVCDGSALNDAGSSIFNGANRYLPNLTDSRFLMGSTSAGSTGGQSSTTISSANLPTHTHDIAHSHSSSSVSGSVGGSDGTHTHGISDPGHTHTGNWSTGTFSTATNPAGSWVVGNATSGSTNSSTTGVTTTTTSSGHGHSFSLSAAGQTLGTTASGNGGFANTAIENRPLYLSVFYVMRVK